VKIVTIGLFALETSVVSFPLTGGQENQLVKIAEASTANPTHQKKVGE
jgi:hypothetical protein